MMHGQKNIKVLEVEVLLLLSRRRIIWTKENQTKSKNSQSRLSEHNITRRPVKVKVGIL